MKNNKNTFWSIQNQTRIKTMNRNILVATTSCLATLAVYTPAKGQTPATKPNIVIIYVDDLGYGDIGVNGAKGVKTPNIDKMAKGGITFTDAHCSAATCTPSRYSLLTGSYAFRNNAAILPGDAPLIIRPGTSTIAEMLQRAGYVTAIVGKWHLGLGDGTINWNEKISPGPNEIGFNYSFIVPATLDRVPCVFVENNHVVNLDPKDPIIVNYDHKIGNLPTGFEDPELLKMKADKQHSNTIINGISRIGYTSGGKAAWWKDEEIPFVLIEKTNRFLELNKDKPIFLYFSFTDIHVPRAPNEKFTNKSTMGKRGDDIAQMDWLTGQVMNKIADLHLNNNTLVIFTSDNGPVLDDGYSDQSEEKVGAHRPGGPYRGGKYSAFEAGTRMPTIVYWPGKVKPGVSNALLHQVDLFASLADLTGQKLHPSDAPDSYDMLSAWLGKSAKGRTSILEESFTLGLREGDWKYITPLTVAGPEWMKNKHIETGFANTPQLYNLKYDNGEKKDLSKTFPDQVKKMQAALDQIKKEPSRKGYIQPSIQTEKKQTKE